MVQMDAVPLPHAGAAAIVVTFPHEVDVANAAGVGADLDAAFGPGVGVVVADLSGTWFCDSSGVHALVMAYKRAQGGNTEFRVVVGPGRVRRVLELLRLDAVLALYPRLDMALVVNDCESPDGHQGPGAGGRRRALPGVGSADDGG